MKFLLIILMCLAAVPAACFESVQVVEARGVFEFNVRYYHEPDYSCIWSNLDYPDTSFNVTNLDGAPVNYPYEGCPTTFGEWRFACNSDSLVYHATWEAWDSTNTRWFTGYDATMWCTVLLTSHTQLTIVRSTPNLSDRDNKTHEVIVNFEDGTSRTFNGGRPGYPDRIILPPGTYEIMIDILTDKGISWVPIHYANPYSGFIEAHWEIPDPTPDKATAWGTIKSLYR